MPVPEAQNVDDVSVELEALSDQERDELETRSQPYLGKWNQLISTTNWEKGAIIVAWQAAMEKSGLPKSGYSDERWSQLVGGATSQHIGRLRRTSQRFGHVFKEYEGLYWSHFYASLDWDDAEMWLEGAIQNKWSVSKMRNARWETMGKRPEDQPQVEQIVVSELDEEANTLGIGTKPNESNPDYVEGPAPEGPDFGDEDRGTGAGASFEGDPADADPTPAAPKIRPFESFAELPDDIMSAANAFKIAIIRHKTEQWEGISLEDLHGLLDALKALATSASD